VMELGRKRRMTVILVGTIAITWFLFIQIQRLVPGIDIIVETVAIFMVVKLVGETIALSVSTPKRVYYFEDFLKEFMYYAALAAVIGVAIQVAAGTIGGQVEPLVPALGVFVIDVLGRDVI